MPPPERLKGLSRRPLRKYEPKPDPPEGYMWMGMGLVRVQTVYDVCRLQLGWYDRQLVVIRDIVKEHGMEIFDRPFIRR